MRRVALIAVVVVVVASVATGIALAASTLDDAERPITGNALDRASTAALAVTGGGRVTGTEVDDEDAYYEVEVTLRDGRQVDVHLDRSFAVVSSTADADTSEDGDGDSD